MIYLFSDIFIFRVDVFFSTIFPKIINSEQSVKFCFLCENPLIHMKFFIEIYKTQFFLCTFVKTFYSIGAKSGGNYTQSIDLTIIAYSSQVLVNGLFS